MTENNNIELSHIDASVVIIGFTSSIGSGATYIAKGICHNYCQYRYYKLSDIIREELYKEGNKTPSIEDLQNKGNYLRKNNRKGYLIEKLFQKIQTEDISSTTHILIDGIKNIGEIYTLRQFPNFYLISVQADQDVRKDRSIKANIFKDYKDFYAADKRDELESDSCGQQVKKCNYLSDIIIMNDDNFSPHSTHKNKSFINGIYEKYIEKIECASKGLSNPEVVPSTNELCMTLAYSLSKKSSCLKRKVGAVIIEKQENKDEQYNHEIPYIVSSGYNDVPISAKPCVFDPEINECYRDLIQKEYIKRIKHCPNCGNKLSFSIKCDKCGETYVDLVKYCINCHTDIKTELKCNECGANIMQYLPGGGSESGKLLDMCRSLHAEEVALLKLTKTSDDCNLILYTTTYPCNLCANKIVALGIKEVVYAEPYPMEDATKTLKMGKVKLTRFEGVKSSAYFKIFM